MYKLLDINNDNLFCLVQKNKDLENEFYLPIKDDVILIEKLPIITKYVKDFSFSNYGIYLIDYFEAFTDLFFIKSKGSQNFKVTNFDEDYVESLLKVPTVTLKRLVMFSKLIKKLEFVMYKAMLFNDVNLPYAIIDSFKSNLSYNNALIKFTNYHIKKIHYKNKAPFYSKGDVIFVEGEALDRLLIVSNGKVGIYKTYQGNVIKVKQVGPNSILNLQSVLSDSEEIFTAIAEENVSLKIHLKEDLKDLIKSDIKITVSFFHHLSKKFLQIYSFLYVNECADPLEKLTTFFTYICLKKRVSKNQLQIKLQQKISDVLKALNMSESDKTSFIILFKRKALLETDLGLEIYSLRDILIANTELKKNRLFIKLGDNDGNNYRKVLVNEIENILNVLKRNCGLNYNLIDEYFVFLSKENKDFQRAQGLVNIYKIPPVALHNEIFKNEENANNIQIKENDLQAKIEALKIFSNIFRKLKNGANNKEEINSKVQIEYEKILSYEINYKEYGIENTYKDISKIGLWFM